MGPSTEEVLFLLQAGAFGVFLVALVFIAIVMKDWWLPWVAYYVDELAVRIFDRSNHQPVYEDAGGGDDLQYFPPPQSFPVDPELPHPVRAYVPVAPIQPASVAVMPVVPLTPVAVPPVTTYIPVDVWVAELFELSAHIVLLAGSGSGKTRTARGLTKHIVMKRGERIIVLDPKANRDTWMGLRVVTAADEIEQRMRELIQEFNRRLALNPTLTEKEADETFERIWIVVDEVSFVKDNCKTWEKFLRRISSMARSLKMHLIVINQSERVDELGLKGRGDLIANFTKIRLTTAGWSGKPARIVYGDRTVEGEWLSYFPTSHEGVTLPLSSWYTPPPIEDEEECESLSPEAAKVLSILEDWESERAPSLNSLRIKMGVRFEVVRDATSQLIDRGFIDERFRVLMPGSGREAV